MLKLQHSTQHVVYMYVGMYIYVSIYMIHVYTYIIQNSHTCLHIHNTKFMYETCIHSIHMYDIHTDE